MDKDGAFMEEADPEVNDQIDAAYRAKYLHYAACIVSTIVSPGARSATIKLAPRPTTPSF